MHFMYTFWNEGGKYSFLMISIHLSADFNIIKNNPANSKKNEMPYSPWYTLKTNILYEWYAKILVELHGWELESLRQNLSFLF